jgi:fatty-acyl-CoA synthase
VQEAAVIAIPDPKWRRAAARVHRAQACAARDADELRAHLAGTFTKWQLPERYEFLEAIPRTSTGKFWKVKLRERFAR